MAALTASGMHEKSPSNNILPAIDLISIFTSLPRFVLCRPLARQAALQSKAPHR
jgi:hypothetical protein